MNECYLDCDAEKRKYCFTNNCICRDFLEKAANNRDNVEGKGMKIQCVVYDFSLKEIIKYAYGESGIKTISDEELKNIQII